MGKYLQVSITYFDAITQRKQSLILPKLIRSHPSIVSIFLDNVKLKTLIIIYKAKNIILPINLQFFYNNRRNTFIWY